MNQRGFTLIEMMIVFCIIFILTAVALTTVGGKREQSHSQTTISWGINGLTESRCIEGYKFVIGDGGQARQIIDEFGKGVRCNVASDGPQPTKPFGN